MILMALAKKPDDRLNSAAGPTGTIQTAFIERLNLTIRRPIAGLARRTWGLAQSPTELRLHLEWWRAYYHFTRLYTSLTARQTDRSHARNGVASAPQLKRLV